jgi:RNA polymerase sigma factor (sigma-70 family)
LEYLYSDIFPKVKAYVCSHSGNEDDALDIFQDAMIALCKQIKTGKYDIRYEIAGFLFSVSRNLWINKIKRNNRSILMPDIIESTEEYDFSDDIITVEKEKVLKELISKLGEKCFQLLQFSIYKDYSGAEICNIMGFTSVDAVKTQKYKCKKKLLDLLEFNPIYKEVIE